MIWELYPYTYKNGAVRTLAFNILLINMVLFLEYNQYVVIFYTRRRKMKKVSLLLTVAICATLLGCGKTENADAGAATAVSAEALESVTESVSVPETDTASTSFTEALADEGTYWMSGYLRASDKDSAGEPDESGVLQAIIYEAYIEDDILTVKGVTNFRNDKAQDPVGMNDADEAAFIITDQTVFQMVGGDEPDFQFVSQSLILVAEATGLPFFAKIDGGKRKSFKKHKNVREN